MDAVLTALAAACALAAGYLHAGRFNPRTSLLCLAALSTLEGGALLMCCWTTSVYVSYVGFILFGALYAFTITVARLVHYFGIKFEKIKNRNYTFFLALKLLVTLKKTALDWYLDLILLLR